MSPSYSKFENILPDEIIQTQIKEELEIARDELKKIISEDQIILRIYAYNRIE